MIGAWAATSLFVSGFFIHFIRLWTGPILGVWFVGTQRPRRGFLWMMAFSVVPSLIFGWRKIPLTGRQQTFEYLGLMLIAAVLSVLPYTFHRLVSPRLPGFLSTLPFPLMAAAIPSLALALHSSTAPQIGLDGFFILWFAATVVWLWNRESRATGIVFAAGFIVAGAIGVYLHYSGTALRTPQDLTAIFGYLCLSASIFLSVWTLFRPLKTKSWASRPDTIARLRSSFTGEPLHIVNEQEHESLISSSGERFPVRNGIPSFVNPDDLTGDNGKYNHLYETIGGFYDDTQRFVAAFRGLEIDSYFESYMNLLEVKAGDSVLETCVGTGLNFKYLPHGTKLSGLDLSPEMLINCQNNLRRWKMEADLYHGNAESLPFADASFDVVYTAGGFNFFSDRSKAIREMIRVAKPGGHLMIEDETEEYVKSTYEKIPFTSSFYSNRKQLVTVPIDLVPPEMEEIHLEMLKKGTFYAITFRKPSAVVQKHSA
jgi:ubiquinone/menaquinone biosynthesis C-methylase UbiE